MILYQLAYVPKNSTEARNHVFVAQVGERTAHEAVASFKIWLDGNGVSPDGDFKVLMAGGACERMGVHVDTVAVRISKTMPFQEYMKLCERWEEQTDEKDSAP